jgi:hypothetical protein
MATKKTKPSKPVKKAPIKPAPKPKAKAKEKPKAGHGGKRTPGPGKSIGRPPGDGRVFRSISISMHPNSWDAFDKLCGTLPRGAYIVKRLKLPGKDDPAPPADINNEE